MPVSRYFSLFFIITTCLCLAAPSNAKGDDILQNLLSPGKLSTFHSSLSGLKNCSKCHSLGKGLSSKKCRVCHKEISLRQKQKKGVHGKLQGECVTCHKGHVRKIIALDHLSFDHNQAVFPLTGSHQKTPCEKCHLHIEKQSGNKRFTYLGLATRCDGCHESPHEKQFGNCKKCHFTESWQRLQFDHKTTGTFKLVGQHQNVSCEKCHIAFQKKSRTNVPLSINISKHCLSCHKDEHQGHMSVDCLNCHSMKGWKPVSFDHDKTKFALRGSHTKLSCKACHLDRQISGTPKDCGACHKKTPHNAPHPKCSQCHNQEGWHQMQKGWQQDRQQHQSFRYPLQGAHTKVECQKCHERQPGTPVYFNMTFTKCADCHKDQHQGKIAPPCSRCHQLDSFKNMALFDHEQANFKLGELHKNIPCEKCHTEQLTYSAPVSCIRCHLNIARFSRGFYQNTSMKLISPKAKIVDCTGCHETTVKNYKVTETTCAKCHEDAYKVYFLEWRQQVTEKITSLETILEDLRKCQSQNDDISPLAPIEETLLFLKKDFEHNYRFSAALLEKLTRDLSDIRYEYCQE